MRDKKWVKYADTAARILLGLVFVVFGAIYFFMPTPPNDTTTAMGMFNAGTAAAPYFWPLLKVVEVVCGLMLFTRRWTPLALVILAPIILQIVLYVAFFMQSGLVLPIVMALLAGFLAYNRWEKYAPLFRA